MSTPAAPRSTLLAVIGVLLAAVLLAIRLATQPTIEWAVVAGVFVAGAVAAILVAVIRRVRLAARVRATAAAHPDAVVMPLLVGGETAAASRWLARGLGDPSLVLASGRPALAVVDPAGLRLAGTAISGLVPAASLGDITLGRTRFSGRDRDAVVLRITVGDEIAPLALVPVGVARPFGELAQDDVADIATRVYGVLHGQDVPRGWEF